MTLRTTAVIAGALGLLMLIAGLIAQEVRPAHAVVTESTVDTPVVVLGPEVLALPELRRIAVNADGGVEAHTARPVDAEAWLIDHSSTYVTGYASWEELSTRTASRIEAQTASPSPSAGATASPEASATAATTTTEATATSEASPSPGASEGDLEDISEPYDYGSGDLWRSNWVGTGRVSLAVNAIGPGEYLIVTSVDGGSLNSIELSAEREVNDAWINPLIWIGLALAALGAVAVLSGIVDIRPVQERIESWTTKRRSRAVADDDPRPGSRRERRLAGSTLPEVDLDDKGDES